MFYIDATFEDLRMQASSSDGNVYSIIFHDGMTGEEKTIKMPAEHLQMVLAFNLHNDGEPKGFEKFYPILEPYFVGWPNTIRPIP